ncbi:FAD-dependent oxidoreductase [Streptomyces sp. NBC_01465]|uniref:FAD-dependent oxidoreductase n=1 Tax=Streptomyces sp. NBC_01465 TaxID=2903878 RepID=UPI002E3729E7|nr:FAD-dependent oxidoreductase [Streptomyces sp. NBC_01465]
MDSMRSDRQAKVAVVGLVGVPADPRGQWFTEAAATVPHLPVHWEVFAHRGGTDDAVAVAEEVVADGGFAAVVAGLREEDGEAALRVYRKAGLPVLLPLAAVPGDGKETDDTVLRMYPPDSGQAAAVARACRDHGVRRLAVLHDGSERGRRLAGRLSRRTGGAESTGPVAEEHQEWPGGDWSGAVALCGTPSGVAGLLRRDPSVAGQLVILTDDCVLPATGPDDPRPEGSTVVVARPAGGGAARTAAAFAALGSALAKHPHQRGAALIGSVRGELGESTGPRGETPYDGWQVGPRRLFPRLPAAPTEQHFEVAVIGGGLVGRATAAELAEAGASVVLVDDGTPGSSASTVSGGLIRAFELDEGERSLACEAYLALWGRPELAPAYGFRRTGALVLLGPADLEPAADSVGQLRELGIPAETVTVAGLNSRWPDLRTDGIAGAVWEPGAGYARGAVALAALLDRARLAGVRVLSRHHVDSLTTGPEGAAVLECSVVRDGDRTRGRVTADVAVVAAGCATPALLGERWPAGQPAASKLIRYGIFEAGGRRLPTIVDAVTGVWARPDGEDGLLAGYPFDEWNVPVAPSTVPDDQQVRWMRDGVSPRLPFLADARLLTGSSGTDLFVEGGRPVLGRLSGLPHTVVAAGWSGAGFKTSPAAARRAAAEAVQLLAEQRKQRKQGL